MQEEGKKQNITQKDCIVEYRFFNPSLGPINGKRSFRVYLKKGNVQKIIDLQTGKEADPRRGTPGLKDILKVIREGNKTSDRHYSRHGDILTITPTASPSNLGKSYRIDLVKFDCKE